MSRISPRRSRPSQLALGAAAALVLAGLIGPAAADSATPQTQTYTTPGVSSFTVPNNVTHITVTAVGAAGGTCSTAPAGVPDPSAGQGGEGASVTATLAVKPGSQLIVGVGGVGGVCSPAFPNPVPGGTGGVNGGAAGGAGDFGGVSGAGGGGASAVLASATSPLIVAGGGGGGGDCAGNGGNADAAGSAATTAACPGLGSGAPGGGGGAGTVAAGGAGGTAGDANASAGGTGTTENGGTGGVGDTTGPSASGGGGGGGLHGGGGGGGGGIFLGGGGGGGGASFVLPSATSVAGPAATTSGASVTITYTAVAAPTATTHKASAVKQKSARLHGSVNGEGLATTYWFQWGKSKHYGHSTSHHTLSASGAAKAVSALLRNLKPKTRYHFRVVARTASGTAYGKDMTFTTKAAAAKPKAKRKATAPSFTG